MSTELERMAARLREIAERLRDSELSDEGVAELAAEAAEIAATAGTEAETALREAAGGADG
jgi:hypothetical protein